MKGYIKIFILLISLGFYFESYTVVKPEKNVYSDNPKFYAYSTPSLEGTGKFYMGREIARFKLHLSHQHQKYNRDVTDSVNLAIEKMHYCQLILEQARGIIHLNIKEIIIRKSVRC